MLILENTKRPTTRNLQTVDKFPKQFFSNTIGASSLTCILIPMALEKSTVKIMICVIHGPYEPWLTILRDGQIKTWMSQKTSIKIINVFGKAIPERLLRLDQSLYFKRWSRSRFIAYLSLGIEAGIKKALPIKRFKPAIVKSTPKGEPGTWSVRMPDSLLLQGVKNLAVFRASLEEEYDYLVTTITSSYINLNKLNQVMTKAERRKFVGGRIQMSGDMQFQQGSFRVFSRDVVEYIVENSNRYQHWLIEDIAMGRLINMNYEIFTNIENCTLESVSSVEELSELELNQNVSYRCKSFVGKYRTDHEVMLLLNQRLS